MKTFVYIATLLVFLSCNKSSDNTNTTNPPQQSISYKVNGVSRSYTAVEQFKITKGIPPISPYTFSYNISAAYLNNGITTEAIYLLVLSNTYSEIAVGNYYCQPPIMQGATTWFVARLILVSGNVTTEYTGQTGDFSQVQITKVQNGYIDGTFTASVTNGAQKLAITDGVFANVKIN
ncbi:MAG TPA: hypothetical protein VK489_11305 [Ferruginibacter sp.]|nr:hypothetical protein [Ferruginibacter sp.]